MNVRLFLSLCLLSLITGCATVTPLSGEENAVSPGAPAVPAAGINAPVESAADPAAMSSEDDEEDESAAPGAPRVKRLKMKPALVNVRPEPGTERPPLAVLKGGKRVTVLEERGSWVKIRWFRKDKSVEGWVYGRFIE